MVEYFSSCIISKTIHCYSSVDIAGITVGPIAFVIIDTSWLFHHQHNFWKSTPISQHRSQPLVLLHHTWGPLK